MQIDKDTLEQIVNLVVVNTVKVLEEKQLLKKAGANEKTAYQKTEALLFNYNGLKRVVEDKKREIEEIRKYGVPTSNGVKEYVDRGGMPQGIVLEEERVEAAVANVQASVQDTVHVLSMIDAAMDALKSDPYYAVLEMRYFEGRTQEDIALEFNCSQMNISKNKSRLVRELSMRLFPNQYVQEMMN